MSSFLKNLFKGTDAVKTEVKPVPNIAKSDTSKPVPIIKMLDEFPDAVAEFKKLYFYDDVKIFTPEDLTVDYSILKEKAEILFVQEPENSFDENAIRVIVPGPYKIGYIYRGKLQDMMNDYLTAGLPIKSNISKVDGTIIYLNIAFYGRTIPAYKEPTKTYKLTGNKNAEMQDNIDICNVGQYMSFNYDYEKEKYIILGDYGIEIGYLPLSANALLESEDVTIVISDILYDENTDVYVDIYEWKQ